MLKTSLIFCALALLALFFADLEITTLDPWQEITRMGWGLVTPDITILYEIRIAFANTLIFALCGIFLGIVLGIILSFFFRFWFVRLFSTFIRSIHEIFWALIFLPIVGLNPVCGILAIAIPYAGIFAKVYTEIFQEADRKSLKGIPEQSNPLSRFFYGILPLIYADIKHYTSYRFECALRSSAILGFVGLPTLGFHLETSFREGEYSESAAILYAFFLLIFSLKYWVKAKWVLIYVCVAFILISKEISFSWRNVSHFFTYEILPWPMRQEGVLSGTYALEFPLDQTLEWGQNILQNEALPGLWNTLILTQIALIASGMFTLLSFPLINRHFHKARVRKFFHILFIILRTTPEYIIAYVLVNFWGPSMLPAIVALSLHNGAILSYLTGKNARLIFLRMDGPRRKTDRYLFKILPRIYGQFLAFLFYRWEVMVRESAILGILGIYTLGFYIDSAIADEKMDKTILLILVTALLNMGIDRISQIIRKGLKISNKLVSSR